MTTLLALGLGYCASRFVTLHPGAFDRVIGSARTPKTSDASVETIAFDGTTASPAILAAIAHADALLISAAPNEAGDPVLGALGAAIEAAPNLASIVYLSTIGVHGDHGGGWIDEESPLDPGQPRTARRIEAEAAWQELGRRRGVPVSILRLAGIYGPGRNALRDVAAGTARRIIRPGQVFNRIHADDIAAAIAACFSRRHDGIVNVTDDLPAPPADPVTFAAGLLGIAPPPAIAFEEAARAMSPMALSFWSANRRVRNGRLKAELGVRLLYPDYRAGLTALFDAGEGAPC